MKQSRNDESQIYLFEMVLLPESTGMVGEKTKRLQGIRYTKICCPIPTSRNPQRRNSATILRCTEPSHSLSCCNLSGPGASPEESSRSLLSWPTTTSPRPNIICSMLTFGPVNHLCAETNHHIVTRNIGPPYTRQVQFIVAELSVH